MRAREQQGHGLDLGPEPCAHRDGRLGLLKRVRRGSDSSESPDVGTDSRVPPVVPGHGRTRSGIGPDGRQDAGRTVTSEVVPVTNETVLIEVVRAWVDQEFPREPATAERAVAMAADARGASVTEACRQARAFLGSWARHPAHWNGDRCGGRLAS